MRHFISLLITCFFSLTTFAETLIRADVSPVIEQSITAQDLTAEDIHNSIKTASSDDFEETPTDNYKAVPQQAVAAPEDKNGHAIVPVAEVQKKEDKDFALKLHVTGRASAQRYFPPKPKVAKTKAVKSTKSKKLAKKLKKTSGKIAKAGKSKKNKTSTSRVAEDHSTSNQ